jgi:hypothetical protein
VLNDAVALLTDTECFEFASVLAGVAVGSDVSAGGSLRIGWVSPGLVVSDAGAVAVPDSVVLVCAPPLLLTVTPVPTSVLDDVVPEVLVVPVAVVWVPVDVDPLVDVEPSADVVAVEVPVDGVAADPVVDSLVEVELAELVDDSEDVPVVSAAATPYPVATAAASHAATAIPPYPPSFAAVWLALREGEGATNRGLTGRLPVMGSTPMA